MFRGEFELTPSKLTKNRSCQAIANPQTSAIIVNTYFDD